MTRPVLILAPADDPHALAVMWALSKNGVQSICHPSLPFGNGASLSVYSDADGERTTCSVLRAETLASIWYRRPKPPSGFGCRDADRNFVEREWNKTQQNVLALADAWTSALWVNDPTRALQAENKLVQLRAARAVGLVFPATLVTNDADEVRSLIGRHGRVVFKTFAPHLWKNTAGDRHYGVDVTLLDAGSDLPPASIGLCPGIYQQYVDKIMDLRVTIIGDRFFAIGIRRREGPAYLDWRAKAQADDYHATSVELDEPLRQQLRALMARLGIVFGCADLVVDRNGQVFFLEVNQAGQFLFVEQQVPELPILQAMTAMLASGRVDYRLQDSVEVKFSDYLAHLDQQSHSMPESSMLHHASVE